MVVRRTFALAGRKRKAASADRSRVCVSKSSMTTAVCFRPAKQADLQVASVQAGGAADRWVTTSDLAHLDEDGYLYIDGRADDVIVRGGFKVAPDTVARALRSHAAVHDAAVAGLADERLGQIPVAAVELRPGASVTPEELRTHCRSALDPVRSTRGDSHRRRIAAGRGAQSGSTTLDRYARATARAVFSRRC